MKITNRRVRFDYQILEKFEAGIALNGAEVKAFRAGKVNLTQAYGKIIGGEAFLINANFSVEKASTRSRKILLHKKQITALSIKMSAKRLTLVPTKMYTKARLIKLELALCRSKKKHQKREGLKKKDIEREIERELRGKDN